MCFATLSLANERATVQAIVDCVNAKSRFNDALRSSETDGLIARLQEIGEYNNVCTAPQYFCLVNLEVSWMFTWVVVLKVDDDGLFAFDVLPETEWGDFSHMPVNVPAQIAEAISSCGVEWKGYWVGEPVFLLAEPKPTPKVTEGFASRPWDGTAEDLLPPRREEN